MDVESPRVQVHDHIIINGPQILTNQDYFHVPPGEISSVHANDQGAFKNNGVTGVHYDAGVMLRFDPLLAGDEFLIRMGLSFVSTRQACSNAEEEIPTFDFKSTSDSSISQFETLLNRIRVNATDVPEDNLVLFYSSVSPIEVLLSYSYTEHLSRPRITLEKTLCGRLMSLLLIPSIAFGIRFGLLIHCIISSPLKRRVK
jgi:hypothetical protein